jgi:dipeptidyl-peptidase-4
MRKHYGLIFCFLVSLAYTQSLTVEKIWKQFEFRAKGVAGFNSLRDGVHYSLMDEKGNLVMVPFDSKEEQPKVLINASDLVWQGKGLAVQDYAFNLQENKVLLMTDVNPIYRNSYTAVYYLFDLQTKKLSPLSNEMTPQTLAE